MMDLNYTPTTKDAKGQLRLSVTDKRLIYDMMLIQCGNWENSYVMRFLPGLAMWTRMAINREDGQWGAWFAYVTFPPDLTRRILSSMDITCPHSLPLVGNPPPPV